MPARRPDRCCTRGRSRWKSSSTSCSRCSLVLVFRAFRKRFVLCTAILATLSFGLSAALGRAEPGDDLLLLARPRVGTAPGRADRAARLSGYREPVRRGTLGAAGLVCLAASIALYRESTPFPGAAALVPTVGSALIIYSGMQRANAGRGAAGHARLRLLRSHLVFALPVALADHRVRPPRRRPRFRQTAEAGAVRGLRRRGGAVVVFRRAPVPQARLDRVAAPAAPVRGDDGGALHRGHGHRGASRFAGAVLRRASTSCPLSPTTTPRRRTGKTAVSSPCARRTRSARSSVSRSTNGGPTIC